MKKLYLLDIIEKYHLGGLVERVKVQINNKTLSVKFIATNKNLIGTLSAPEISIEDCEFGIYDTTQLIKLVSIMGQDIEVKVEQKDKVANKLFLADTEYNLEYVLANTMLIPNVPNADEPQYDLEANIDREFVDKFAKAKKALDTEVFTVMSSLDSFENTVISFNLGEINGHNNKISFHTTIEYNKLFLRESTRRPKIYKGLCRFIVTLNYFIIIIKIIIKSNFFIGISFYQSIHNCTFQ